MLRPLLPEGWRVVSQLRVAHVANAVAVRSAWSGFATVGQLSMESGTPSPSHPPLSMRQGIDHHSDCVGRFDGWPQPPKLVDADLHLDRSCQVLLNVQRGHCTLQWWEDRDIAA